MRKFCFADSSTLGADKMKVLRGCCQSWPMASKPSRAESACQLWPS